MFIVTNYGDLEINTTEFDSMNLLNMVTRIVRLTFVYKECDSLNLASQIVQNHQR